MAGVKRKRMEEERGGARLFLHRHRVTDTHFAYCRMRVGALRGEIGKRVAGLFKLKNTQLKISSSTSRRGIISPWNYVTRIPYRPTRKSGTQNEAKLRTKLNLSSFIRYIDKSILLPLPAKNRPFRIVVIIINIISRE